MVMMMKLSCCALLLLANRAAVQAFPNFSGTCLAGPNLMPEGTEHFGGNRGELEDGGFQVQVIGIGDIQDVTEIETGQGYGVTITSEDTFWGYFFRVSSDDGISRAGSIGIPPNSEGAIQIMESNGEGITRTDNDDEQPGVCEATVAGASHVDVETGRERLTFILDVAEPGEVRVEILMMFAERIWYYSSYSLNVLATSTDPPTASPTITPPTASPTITPTSTPNISPTGAPVADSTTAPVLTAEVPTGSPVEAEAGENLPTADAPVSAMAEPSTAPTVLTTSAATTAAYGYHHVTSLLIFAVCFT